MSNDNKQIEEAKLDQINENANKPSRLKGFAVAMGVTALTATTAFHGYGFQASVYSDVSSQYQTDLKADTFDRITFDAETGKITPIGKMAVEHYYKEVADIIDTKSDLRDYDSKNGTFTYNERTSKSGIYGMFTEQIQTSLGDKSQLHSSDYLDASDAIGKTYDSAFLNGGSNAAIERLEAGYAQRHPEITKAMSAGDSLDGTDLADASYSLE